LGSGALFCPQSTVNYIVDNVHKNARKSILIVKNEHISILKVHKIYDFSDGLQVESFGSQIVGGGVFQNVMLIYCIFYYSIYYYSLYIFDICIYWKYCISCIFLSSFFLSAAVDFLLFILYTARNIIKASLRMLLSCLSYNSFNAGADLLPLAVCFT